MVALETLVASRDYGTCSLKDITAELAHWASSFCTPGASSPSDPSDGLPPAVTSRSELAAARAQGISTSRSTLSAALLKSLMKRSPSQCVYRLAPLEVDRSRPIVLIKEDALQEHGKRRILFALWQAERSRSDGEDREYGALYDELSASARRARQVLRMAR